MEKYVITGGPCTGKTTLVNALEQHGYVVIPEAARQIIYEEKQKSDGILPWTDFSGFQNLVVRRQISLEASVDADFGDRSGIDGIAYCWLGNVCVPDELAKYVASAKYSAVFLLDRLPYKQDAERVEDDATAEKIHGLIETAYRECGHNIIRVPVLPVEQRVEFIINILENFPQVGDKWSDRWKIFGTKRKSTEPEGRESYPSLSGGG
ncbi:ATP-binding protein [Candidatus Woesearchaeota archaeon]|nr:ATP-binding protein [Candidatus Woesearchaeota archaeon]